MEKKVISKWLIVALILAVVLPLLVSYSVVNLISAGESGSGRQNTGRIIVDVQKPDEPLWTAQGKISVNVKDGE